jgi:hypothetical protein
VAKGQPVEPQVKSAAGFDSGSGRCTQKSLENHLKAFCLFLTSDKQFCIGIFGYLQRATTFSVCISIRYRSLSCEFEKIVYPPTPLDGSLLIQSKSS